jgi:phosphoenolpyruvate carboxykinase (GTP)
VYVGATIESETTTATIGKTGVRVLNPMSNIDFLTVPLGTYLTNHIMFGNKLKQRPKVFATNYFLKSGGKYCNEKVDKKVWILWAEGRVHDEYKILETPVGFLPRYEDLKALFKEVFSRDYTQEDYDLQFSIRLDRLMEKYARMEEFFKSESGLPKEFWDVHNRLRDGVKALKDSSGRSELPPSFFRET